MRKQIKIFILILVVLQAIQLSGQSFIGSFEIYESNGTYYHEAGTDDNKIDTKSIILKYQDGVSPEAIESFVQANNLMEMGIYANYFAYKLPSNISYFSFCQGLAQSNIVNYIEPSVYFEYTSSTFIPNDHNDAYYLELLQVYEAWNITTGNKDVVVAILDTGLEFDDEEFGPDDTPISNLFENVPEDDWEYWDEPDTGNEYNEDDNGVFDENGILIIPYIDDWVGYDVYQGEDLRDNDVRPEGGSGFQVCNGYLDKRLHGTWVAGIVAAKTNNNNEIAGIAGGDVANNKSGVSILPIKVSGYVESQYGCYNFGGLTSTNVLEAIKYAHSMGADIINMSFKVNSLDDEFETLENYIDLIYDDGNGPLFVAAAGNSGSVKAPANWNSVIAVGSIKYNDMYSSHSFGYSLELVAPGFNIPVIFGGQYDGTSFAAPMVSATAALMLSVNPDLTSSEIRFILRETAYKNSSYQFNMYPNAFNVNIGWHERFGFGRINTYEAVCMALGYYGDLIVEDDVTWDSPQVSTNDIYIENGFTLTLTSTLHMDPSAKIIVQPGGKFIIDGGTITNYPFCSGENLKWQGIEVWGDPEESQQDDNGTYKQGYLVLKNGGTIENAQTAILLGKTGDYNGSGGGIIKAYDSYFTNNAKSVYFYPYKNMIELGEDPKFEGNNEAIFRNCEFTINENYFSDSQFYKHADVVKVKKIRFYACDFKRESNENTSLYCSGIESYNGGLSVHEFNSIPCTFEGLYCGIVITDNSTTVDYDSYIQNSVFTNNSKGIKLNDMKNIVSIRENTFHVGYNEPDKGICAGSQGYGIFLDNSNTFVIEDNFFYKYVNAPANGDYIGIEAFNTETSSDEIIGNTFDGLTHANHTTNTNWYINDYPPNRFKGLAYYCNLQSNNSNDLFFTWDNNFSVSGVQTGQGSLTRTAGNTFTQNISGYNIYNNTSHGVGYYYDSDNSLEEPIVYTSGATHVITHAQTLDADCNSGGIGHRSFSSAEKQVLENEYIAFETNYTSVKSLYESLEDGGNTEALNTEVSTSWPNDMWELRAELLGLSPYLTTKVLKTAADKTEVLPESVLFEILSANPEELKKAELMNYLENKEQPLPEYMISILQQLAAGQTAKTILQNDMADYHRDKSRTAMQMLVAMQYDEVFDFNTYRIWLNRLGGMQADYKIIASFVQEDNMTDALALANLFPELYNLQGTDLTEHEYYMDMLNLDITLKQENRSPMTLSSTELAMVEEIANDSKGSSGAQARGLLEHFYGQHFCNCINTTVDANKSTSASIKPNEFAEAMGLKIQAEPNPATTWVSFDYELPLGNDKAQLLIRNTEGKQIALFQMTDKLGQQVWDTHSLKTGTYIYEFISGELKQTGKIVIIK